MPEALLVLFLDILEPHARGLANVLGIVEPLAGGPTNLLTLWSLVPEALPMFWFVLSLVLEALRAPCRRPH